MSIGTWSIVNKQGHTTTVTGSQRTLCEVIEGMERCGSNVVHVQSHDTDDEDLSKVEELEIINI